MARKPDSIINQIAAAVAFMPGMTGAELSAFIERPSAYRRLSEVKRLGLVERRGRKICSISSKVAWTWYPADKQPEPDRGKLTPSQEIKRLNARIEFLVNENEKLKALLDHEKRVSGKLSTALDELC